MGMSIGFLTIMDFLTIVKNYLNAIEKGDELDQFYAIHVEQTEYPNRLVPNGITRDLTALKEASLKGQKVLTSQTYDIQRSYVSGNTVIIEAIWTGTLAVPVGQIPIGGQMKAWFAQFYEFDEVGKIVRQRNYDCFEPF
ncbi:unnamed protein product [Didymodactylos carnosus]|uniref:SnoaL-like domain-containing protein n=1 Tax=Didymodactylos carnosus TaxID=1234261 RepID=A0A8S2FU61_9BILA|nr:unnamed protein product [Didymodactylos carnosus]CAF4351043.1 unnamed protein product [Didymodactylos carnosus]